MASIVAFTKLNAGVKMTEITKNRSKIELTLSGDNNDSIIIEKKDTSQYLEISYKKMQLDKDRQEKLDNLLKTVDE